MTLFNIQTESVKSNGRYNAAGKPIFDTIKTLERVGSTNLPNVRSVANVFDGKFTTRNKLRKFFFDVQALDEVVIQYPLYMSYGAVVQLLRFLVKQRVEITFFVHDINSLRLSKDSTIKGIGHTNNPRRSLQNELHLLSYASQVIVPTLAMKNFLSDHGLSKPYAVLNLYDYLDGSKALGASDDVVTVPQNIVFAGNLTKAAFLAQVKPSYDISYQVFGIQPQNFQLSPFVDYLGAFPADELVNHFKPGFGLVWDGNSISGVSGVLGNYLRYNSPFKASMYISAGLPIIVWNESAIAEYVKHNNLGIVASSLNDAEKQIHLLTVSDYNSMRENINHLARLMSQGEMALTAFKARSD